MPKKHKSKPLTKGELVRAKARATIGQPKATQIHHSFKPKTKRGYRQHELNEYTSLADMGAGYFHMSTPNPILEGAPVLAQRGDPSMVPANVSAKVRPQKNYVKPVPGIRYSPEVIEHCNYLRRIEGQPAVEQYLSELRSTESMSTSHLGMVEALRDQKEAAKEAPTGGGIEASIADARRKQQFYAAEAVRNAEEAAKYQNVVNALQIAWELMTGKRKTAPTMTETASSNAERDIIPRPGRVGGKMREKGYWPKRIPAYLLEVGQGNAKRADVIRNLAELENCSIGSVDQAIRKCRLDGLIAEVDGMLIHPDWTK